MSSYWLHFDPVVFPLSGTFDPERWLNADVEQLKVMNKYYVPFARGSRTCLGQK